MSSNITPESSSQVQKSQIKQVIISRATRRDAWTMSSIYFRAFEHGPNRDIFWPKHAGLFGDALLQSAQPVEARKMKMDIVGTDIFMKATVQFEDSEGGLVERVVGYGHWTAPDGPRRRSIWEWILARIIYPLYNFINPLPELSEKTERIVQEIFDYQLNGTFGPGGPAHGRSYWYLHMLCIDPLWQGCGIGTALLQWSFDKAAASNSVVYLETSPMGLPVYLAKGFRITSTLTREINGIQFTVPGMIWEPTLGKVQ